MFIDIVHGNNFQKKKMVIIVFLIPVLFSCKEKEIDFSNDVSVTEVEIVKAAEKILDNNLNSFGTVSYKSKTDLTVQVAGTITGFSVKEGTFVKKGQILAVLKNIQLEIQKEQYVSNLQSAEASLKLVQTELNQEILGVEGRLLSIEKSELNVIQKQTEYELQQKNFEDQEVLHQIGGVTDSSMSQLKIALSSSKTEIEILKKELEMAKLGLRDEDLIKNGIEPSNDKEIHKKQIIELNVKSKLAQVEQAKAGVESAKQQLRAVNMMISELVIKAPVDGIVGQNYYENGEYIEANQKITTLIDTTDVYAMISIQEQDMVNFEKGTPILVKIPSLNQEFKTSISEISPIADASSGNFSVKALLPNRKGEIKPGMFIRCSIQRKSPEHYPAIPETCLFATSGNAAKVFVVLNGFAVQKTLKIVGKKDGFIWTDDSIKDGDILIDRPSPFLKEGQKVVFQ